MLANDGSTIMVIIHYAVMGAGSELNTILDILLDNRLSPFTGRKDATTPIDLLVAGSGRLSDGSPSERILRRPAELSEAFPGKRECLTGAG